MTEDFFAPGTATSVVLTCNQHKNYEHFFFRFTWEMNPQNSERFISPFHLSLHHREISSSAL